MSKGGASKPVHVISASDLRENGGNYKLENGAAIKVTGFSTPDKVAGGKLQAVYIVPDGFPVQGGEPISITNAIPVSQRGLQGGLVAIPIYVTNGSEWPIEYLIRDEFTDERSAGDVDGTVATPGPGKRSLTDTEDTVSISGGALVWSVATTVIPWMRWLSSSDANIPITRAAGVSVHFMARHSSTGSTKQILVSLGKSSVASSGPASAGADESIQFRTQGAATPVRLITNGANNTNLAHSFPAVNVWGEYCIVVKSAGAQLYYKDAGAWEKIGDWSTGTDSPMYLRWASNPSLPSDGELDFIRVTTRPPAGIPVPS